MDLEVVKFIKGHKNNWKDLLKESPYCLTINEDDNYAIFKYSQVESDFNEQICKECRGLIIDKNTLNPVALSFIKFFNVQEEYADKIDWKKSKCQEKIDGSKILLWFNNYTNKWQLSTSGQLNAYEARVSNFNITFGQLFDRALNNLKITKEQFELCLNKNYCYTFELISPESRVVIPYKETKIYFIGLRNVIDFDEYSPDKCVELCKIIPRPKEYSLSTLEDCLNATAKMGFDEEGFVVIDNHWKRIKIKSPAYVSCHHIRSNINSYSAILSLIEKGQKDDILKVYPEYSDYFNEVENKLYSYKKYILKGINDLSQKMTEDDIDRKSLALFIKDNYSDISSWLFKFIDVDLINLFIETEWSKLTKQQKIKKLGLKEVEVKDDDYMEE